MRLPRFLVEVELPAEGEVALPSTVAHQVRRVLRLRPEARICLLPGDGQEVVTELVRISAAEAVVRVLERRRPEVERKHALEVALAVLKGERLEWCVQKLTELGVTDLVLLVAERCVPDPGPSRWPARVARLERVAAEAVEQCGRTRLPRIAGPLPLSGYLARPSPGPRLLLDPDAARPLARLVPAEGPLALLVGPEGGWTASETADAVRAGAVQVELGPRILRAETAAVAAVGLAALVQEASSGKG